MDGRLSVVQDLNPNTPEWARIGVESTPNSIESQLRGSGLGLGPLPMGDRSSSKFRSEPQSNRDSIVKFEKFKL